MPRKDKRTRFTALLHHVTVNLLGDSYYALKRGAAPGVEVTSIPRRRRCLNKVAAHVLPVEYPSGRVVFVMGDEPKGLYIIAGGALRTARQTADGRKQVLSVDYPCATVGEVPLFDRGLWHATAATRGETRLLFIPRDDLYRLRGAPGSVEPVAPGAGWPG